MKDTAVSLRNVSFRYSNGDKGVLDSVGLEIKRGECVLLCGSSGCGKTTVTRSINGLIPHYYEGNSEGEVEVFGRNIKDTPIEDLAGTVGSVFQNPRSQFFCVDTTAEIAFGCENMGLPENEILRRLNSTVSEMHIENLLERSIFNLSGGEKQKIACAGVSAMLPDLIVLDEPTSNLDLDAVYELRSIMNLWKEQGKTIVIAEHRLGWLRGLCDRIVYLDNGRIVKEFSGSEFFGLDDTEINALGLRALNMKSNYMDLPKGLTEIKKCGTSGVLTVENFTYSYGGRNALNIKKLDIPKGSVTAIVGHNGAGKSTFTKCLCGLLKGFRGRVVSDGKPLRPKDMMKLSYMVMQDVNHQLFAETVLEEAMLGADDSDEPKALELLTKLEIAEYKDRHPMSLSGGQKQRTAIASALMAGKKLLVFDEPTSGLDFSSMKCTSELIHSLGEDVTVMIVTHDMELIESCCTHVLHIENGTIE